VLEIRRCPEPRRRETGRAQATEEPPQQEISNPAETDGGVVVPLRAGARARTRRGDSAG
jgi:hypothetical protein